MRPFLRTSLLLVSCLVAAALPASAQYGGGGGARGGRARAQAATAEPPRIPPTVAALVLEHGGDLQLSESQLALVESVRRTQDSANRPWLQRLDSLRNGPRPVNPADLSQEQRDEMARRRADVAAAVAGMREANAEARQRVMAALNPDQQQKAAALEAEAQKKARDDGPRQAEAYGGGRRRGGMGRSPED